MEYVYTWSDRYESHWMAWPVLKLTAKFVLVQWVGRKTIRLSREELEKTGATFHEYNYFYSEAGKQAQAKESE